MNGMGYRYKSTIDRIRGISVRCQRMKPYKEAVDMFANATPEEAADLFPRYEGIRQQILTDRRIALLTIKMLAQIGCNPASTGPDPWEALCVHSVLMLITGVCIGMEMEKSE